MPKRLTITEKWNEEWFLKLSPQAKLIWVYLLDNCDLTGVCEVNVDLMRYRIGFSGAVSMEKHLVELNEVANKIGVSERIEWFADRKKVWIVNFIKVQYGELTENSSTHRGVIKVLKSNELVKGLPKGYETLVGVVKAKAKAKVKSIKEKTEYVRGPVGMDVTQAAYAKAVSDKKWVESVCMGYSLKTSDLEKWLHRFSVSIAQDTIENFSDSAFRKMFGGWLSKRLSAGDKLAEPGFDPLYRYKKNLA